MSNIDIYKFRDLVANKQKQIEESVQFQGTPEQANDLADELQQYLDDLTSSYESIKQAIKHNLPKEYRYMESYTFAHLETCLGGYGYSDRMIKTFESVIEDLREHAEGDLDNQE
jgi:hypothetical protein